MHNGWSIVTDKTILLVIPVDDALARLATKSGHEHFERREILEKVQNRYLEFARAETERFVVVDAMLDKDEVARFVADTIRLVVVEGRETEEEKIREIYRTELMGFFF